MQYRPPMWFFAAAFAAPSQPLLITVPPAAVRAEGASFDDIAQKLGGQSYSFVDAEGAPFAPTDRVRSLALGLAYTLALREEGRPIEQFWLQDGRYLHARADEGLVTVEDLGPSELVPVPTRPSDLARHLGGGPIDGPWTGADLDLLWHGFSLLTPEEQAVLQQTPLVRKKKGVGRDNSPAWNALGRGPTGNRITFFSTALDDAYAPAVLGTRDQPYPVQLRNVVHELGHGLFFAPYREGYWTWRSDRSRRAEVRDCTTSEVLDVVIADIVQRAGVELALTDYARTSDHEAVAEAFALWKLHPTRLEAQAPTVFRWFEEGGHHAWRADPTWGVCAHDAVREGLPGRG